MTINKLVVILALIIGAGTSQSTESTNMTSTDSEYLTCPSDRDCKIGNNCWINGTWYNPCPPDPTPPPDTDPGPGPQILLPN